MGFGVWLAFVLFYYTLLFWVGLIITLRLHWWVGFSLRVILWVELIVWVGLVIGRLFEFGLLLLICCAGCFDWFIGYVHGLTAHLLGCGVVVWGFCVVLFCG